MSRATYFLQSCPTCGRRLEIRIELLGKTLACSHCHARFEAQYRSDRAHDASMPAGSILDRVDQLLAAGDDYPLPPR